MSSRPKPVRRAPRLWLDSRHKRLSAREVAAAQRRRVHAALTEALAEVGYDRVSVKQMIEPAGISRRTFYELFEGKGDVLLLAHQEALSRLDRVVCRARADEPDWPRRVRAGVRAVLAFVAEEPAAARLVIGEPFMAGPFAGRCQDRLLKRFGPELRHGRHFAQLELPAITEAGLIAGVASVIAMRLQADGGASVRGLAPQLAEILLAPYLGREEVARIVAGDDR